MTPALLVLLLLCVTKVSLSSAKRHKNPTAEHLDVPEAMPRPKADLKNAVLIGDIAVRKTLNRNADPCTDKGCKWPKTGRYVYVPYYISDDYTSREKAIIFEALQTFKQKTCIRLIPWESRHKDYLYFQPSEGCWSYVGHQKGGQFISLDVDGCLHKGTVQHEVLHALGFHHEQVRSDRDKYIRILFENIEKGKERNFEKVQTNNLLTSYDFHSVMQYSNYAFSKDQKPTIIAKYYPTMMFGDAEEMDATDIFRVNMLYGCGVRWWKKSTSRLPKSVF